MIIHKVELQVPSPIYIFVQCVALNSQGQPTAQLVNTKKKLRVDPGNRNALFTSERISMIKNVLWVGDTP